MPWDLVGEMAFVLGVPLSTHFWAGRHFCRVGWCSPVGLVDERVNRCCGCWSAEVEALAVGSRGDRASARLTMGAYAAGVVVFVVGVRRGFVSRGRRGVGGSCRSLPILGACR
jgi:hypothetical protein